VTRPAEPTVTVVIPAYNAAAYLPQTVGAVMAAVRGERVLVVDAGSTDGTAEVAVRLGAEVIRLDERAGPALARNRGADAAATDVVLFIDADCVANADVVTRVKKAFAKDPHLVSLTGSYDDAASCRDFFSQYMNLRHHFMHQNARKVDSTFWAGCGAVRLDIFRSLGGFDYRQFLVPEIEDVELGLRLQRRGRTNLDPRLNVKHLKRWTLRSVVLTDILRRALPWSRLIVRTSEFRPDLNLAVSQVVSAVIAPFALLGVFAAFVSATSDAWVTAAVCAVPVAVLAGIQHKMLGLFMRARGPDFAIAAWLFHQVHLIYSSATLGVVAFGWMFTRRRGTRSPGASS
jgi:GT2 family glycosyltransferase